MKLSHNDKMRFVFVLLAGILLLLVLFMSSGCEVFKFKQGKKADSTAVSKSNTEFSDSSHGGSLKKENSKSIEENEWFRMILKMAQKKDSPVNNYYPQPATIIYEGGKGKREETKSSTDSSWYQNIMRMIAMSMDSLSRKMETMEKTKHSETKGLGLLAFLGIFIGLLLLYDVIKRAISNYTIIKKQRL